MAGPLEGPAAALVPVAAFAGFILLWMSVLRGLAVAGGWSKLASRWRAPGPPGGRRLRMQSAKVGWVGYNNCLTIGVGPEGLYLAPWPMFSAGHPPLLIPWSEVASVERRKVLFAERVELRVGRGDAVTLSLFPRAAEAARPYLESRFPVWTTR